MAHIVRQVGKPKEFTLPNGKKIVAKDKIWIPEYRRFVPCSPYDNHTIYETGYTSPGSPPYLCTCGSVAVIVGYDAYKQDASAQGLMFVCLFHAQNGRHTNTSN